MPRAIPLSYGVRSVFARRTRTLLTVAVMAKTISANSPINATNSVRFFLPIAHERRVTPTRSTSEIIDLSFPVARPRHKSSK